MHVQHLRVRAVAATKVPSCTERANSCDLQHLNHDPHLQGGHLCNNCIYAGSAWISVLPKSSKKGRPILIMWRFLRAETWWHISRIREKGHTCAWLRKTPNDVRGETSKPLEKAIQTRHTHRFAPGPEVNHHHRSCSVKDLPLKISRT